MENKLSRREFLGTAASIAIAASMTPAPKKIQGEIDLAVIKSDSTRTATKVAINTLGGINKFVKPGDSVVIKPNMSFPNPPEWGSTTNPDVVATIIELCLDAGARSILIIDHPMTGSVRYLKPTGIPDVCQKMELKRAQVSIEMDEKNYTKTKLKKAKALKKTKVNKAILESDVLINVPVAKSHSVTTVSFGMKNLMGLIWDRQYLHQRIDLHQGIADLSMYIKPSLIIMDSIRSLITNGPTGPGVAKQLNTIIAGTDPVAVDAYAVGLSSWNGRRYIPEEIKHIVLANAMNIGEMNLSKLTIEKMEV